MGMAGRQGQAGHNKEGEGEEGEKVGCVEVLKGNK